MLGRQKGTTWKPYRVLTDEQIAEIMTREHGCPMGKTAVTDTATRAERKLRERLMEFAVEAGVIP